MALDLIKMNYNPDVLSCLANLSNDEVFTPPEVVNQMLDMLPQELFCNPDTTFLDPATKSGVFLREIAKRLMRGLEKQIPDLQERVDHIFQKQLFGIAMTELTSLLARRSLYCSKYPNSSFSVTKFNSPEGNIRFRRTSHTWPDGKCIFCGASKTEYDRGDGLETHAYEIIHTNEPKGLFNMKFDVIIGNPPYQLSDGGHGASAMPIYQKFVTASQKLNPRFLCFIIPSRWTKGGRGLDEFRANMLNDDRIEIMHDFYDASDCFPGVEIKGGVCYFLWNRDYHGMCHIYTHNSGNKVVTESVRPLLEKGMSTFIRSVEQISVLHKVLDKQERSFADIVTANDPYGFDVRVEGSYKRVKPQFKMSPFPGAVTFYYNGWRKEGVGYMERSSIRKNEQMIDKWKIFVPKAWGTGDPGTDLVNAFIVKPNSASTETYLTVGPFDSEKEANNVLAYMHTKFFHFMVFLIKITQNAMKNIYTMVPIQDFSREWTDQELYRKYGLCEAEIEFIESTIRSYTQDGGED